MATRDFSKYFLYRWRYVISYVGIGLLLAGLLLFAGLSLPGGLSQAEMDAVVKSSSLSLSDRSTLAITNLPYHALQAGIFALFGITLFTIKLPSLILALFSAVGLILLLRRWFKPNIAVLASLIAISTGQFLFIAQLGTGSILYIFWPIALLLLGTQVTRVKKHRTIWKFLFAITAALSLYTPLGIYPLIAVGLAIIFHPHLRAIIRRLSNVRIGIALALFALFVAPLIWLIVTNLSFGLTLLGVPSSWPPDILANSITLLKQYFMFWGLSTSEVMTPVFGLGSTILIGLGIYRLIRTRDTTRSYLVIFWILCLIPVLILNPGFTTVSFVPSVLVLAAGLTSLIGFWYRLFPLNPYARIIGLIPIIVLVLALITTGVARYVYGYHFSPQVVPLFSNDLALLPKDAKELVVTPSEKAFYEAVATHRTDLTVTTKPTAKEIVSTHAARENITSYTITRIISNSRTKDGDRFYVMTQKVQKTEKK